jgi:hypothetical protein
VPWSSGFDQGCEEELRSLRLAIEPAQQIVEVERSILELDQILQEVPRALGIRTRCIGRQIFGSDPIYTNEDTTVEFPDLHVMQQILSMQGFANRQRAG